MARLRVVVFVELLVDKSLKRQYQQIGTEISETTKTQQSFERMKLIFAGRFFENTNAKQVDALTRMPLSRAMHVTKKADFLNLIGF